MSDDIKVDLELDLKGLLCPLPMVKVSQNINNVEVGGVERRRVEVLAPGRHDPEALRAEALVLVEERLAHGVVQQRQRRLAVEAAGKGRHG